MAGAFMKAHEFSPQIRDALVQNPAQADELMQFCQAQRVALVKAATAPTSSVAAAAGKVAMDVTRHAIMLGTVESALWVATGRSPLPARFLATDDYAKRFDMLAYSFAALPGLNGATNIWSEDCPLPAKAAAQNVRQAYECPPKQAFRHIRAAGFNAYMAAVALTRDHLKAES